MLRGTTDNSHVFTRRRITQSVGLLFLYLILFNDSLALATNDPDYSLQWNLRNDGQLIAGQAGVVGADVGIEQAWTVHNGIPSIIVALVGPGVDAHPEFANRLLPGRAFMGDPFDSSDTTGQDTHLAGLIAAAHNNGLGIAGINPYAVILPVRITQGPQGNLSAAASGIRWAVDHGARIIVVTRTFHIMSSELENALDYASDHDVLVIAPIGDEENPELLYPAAFDNCLAVSATTNRDEFASISNWSDGVDLSAPGQNVWSTARTEGYQFRSGSVVAAAIVAGVASLVRSYAPHLSATQVRQLLIDTSTDLGEPGYDDRFGAGRLNASAVLANATAPALRFEPIDLVPETIVPDEPASFRLRVASVAEQLLPASAFLFYSVDGGPFGIHSITALEGGVLEAVLPPTACGAQVQFYLRATGHLGTHVHNPITAPASVYQTEALVRRTIFHDDFESDLGWVVEVTGDGPASGIWVRDVPVATSVQPGFDASPGPDGRCFLTGQHRGGAESLTDVDGGPITVTSPVIHLPEGDAEVSFRAWFQSQNGVVDSLEVEASTDGGGSWVSFDTISTGIGWRDFAYRLSDFPEGNGSNLRIRFTVSDAPNDSLTEAAIDEVRVTAIQCFLLRGDANGDGFVNLLDHAALASCVDVVELITPAGPCSTADFNRDGVIDLRDYAVLQLWFGTE